jgi:DNA-binding GntR family transcriptional regulator
LSIKFALENKKGDGFQRLRELADEMRRGASQGDFSALLQADAEFHREVCRIADDSFLEKCLMTLITPLFAFVLIRLEKVLSPADLNSIVDHHCQILELFELEDPSEAAKQMQLRLNDISEIVLLRLYNQVSAK